MKKRAKDHAKKLFLSYNRADVMFARALKKDLEDLEFDVFFDEDDLKPGIPYRKEIETSICQVDAVLVCFGEKGEGRYQAYEINSAISRQASSPIPFPVIPVLLPGLKDLPNNLLVDSNTWVDFREPGERDDAIKRLLFGLGGTSNSEKQIPQLTELLCPFRGLLPFREIDSQFFFGRDAEIDDALERLSSKPNIPLFIRGNSGSGKSSLVRAGLIPRLRNGKISGVLYSEVLVMRPGRDPFRALARALLADTQALSSEIHHLQTLFRSEKSAFVDVLEDQFGSELSDQEGARVLLFVDQFEELFLNSRSTEDVESSDLRSFLELISEAIKAGICTVVATSRDDYDLQILESLSFNYDELHLGRMSRDDLRSCIVKPAKLVGLSFDPDDLAETILDDVGFEPGRLPLLQHLLLELWSKKDTARLTKEAYEQIGGVDGAIEKRAEFAFAQLIDTEESVVRRLMISMVSPGEGRQDARTSITNAEMSEEERRVVDFFSAPSARLLTVSNDRVEPSHESLIHTWTRLTRWLDPNRNLLRIRDRVRDRMTVWMESNEASDDLLPPSMVPDAKRLMGAEDRIMVNEFRRYIEKSNHRVQWTFWAKVSAVGVAVVLLAGYGVNHKNSEKLKSKNFELESTKSDLERQNKLIIDANTEGLIRERGLVNLRRADKLRTYLIEAQMREAQYRSIELNQELLELSEGVDEAEIAKRAIDHLQSVIKSPDIPPLEMPEEADVEALQIFEKTMPPPEVLLNLPFKFENPTDLGLGPASTLALSRGLQRLDPSEFEGVRFLDPKERELLYPQANLEFVIETSRRNLPLLGEKLEDELLVVARNFDLLTAMISAGFFWNQDRVEMDNKNVRFSFVLAKSKIEEFQSGAIQPSQLTTVALIVSHSQSRPGGSGKYKNESITEHDFSKELISLIEAEVNGALIKPIIVFQDNNSSGYSALPAKLNDTNADFAVSIHGNSFDGTLSGSEVLYASGSNPSRQLAQQFLSATSKALNLPSRGIKPRTSSDRGGALLQRANMPMALLEPFFIDNPSDLKTAVEKKKDLAKAYAREIENFAISFQSLGQKPDANQTVTSKLLGEELDIKLETENLSKSAFLTENHDAIALFIDRGNDLLIKQYGDQANLLRKEEVWSIFFQEAGLRNGKIDPSHLHSEGERGLFPIPENIRFWIGESAPKWDRMMSAEANTVTMILYLGQLKNKTVTSKDGFSLYRDLFNYEGIAEDPWAEAQLMSAITYGVFYSGTYRDRKVPYQEVLAGIANKESLATIVESTTFVRADTSLVEGREKNFQAAKSLLQQYQSTGN